MKIYSQKSETISDWQWHDGSLKNISDNILALVPKDSKNILDVGCGTGRLVAQLAQSGFMVAGIDVESEVIEIGRAIFANEGISAKLSVCNLLSNSFTSTSPIDTIVCSEVLEHVENWSGLIEKIQEQLEVGGSLIISVPRDPKQFSILDHYAEHLRRFQDRELLAEIEKQGFKIEKVLFLGWPCMRSIVGLYSILYKLLKLDHAKATEKRWGSRSVINSLVNSIFYFCLRFDNFFSSLPFGTTIVVRARKIGG